MNLSHQIYLQKNGPHFALESQASASNKFEVYGRASRNGGHMSSKRYCSYRKKLEILKSVVKTLNYLIRKIILLTKLF